MKIFNILITVLFCASVSSAQVKAYLKSTGGWFGRDYLVVDGENMYPSGIDHYKLSERFASNSQAAEFARLHESNASKAAWFLWGGLAATLTYGAVTYNNGHFDSGGYWGIFLIGLSASGYYNSQSRMYFYKAINSYNGLPVAPDVSLSFEPTLSGARGLLTYTF